jgi:hypothetical protein
MNDIGKNASNNGMHPTADTNILKFLQSPGAAGDARRSAAHIGTRRRKVYGLIPARGQSGCV